MKPACSTSLLIALLVSTPATSMPPPPKEYRGTFGEWQNGNCKEVLDDDENTGWGCLPPKRFSGVVIALLSDARVRVWLSVWGVRSECNFDGLGDWYGSSIIAQDATFDDLGICKLTVTIKDGKLETKGEGCGPCGSWINHEGASAIKKLSSRTMIPPRYTGRNSK